MNVGSVFGRMAGVGRTLRHCDRGDGEVAAVGMLALMVGTLFVAGRSSTRSADALAGARNLSASTRTIRDAGGDDREGIHQDSSGIWVNAQGRQVSTHTEYYDGKEIEVPDGGELDIHNGHAVAVPPGGRVEYDGGRQTVVPSGGRVDYYNGHAIAVPRGGRVEYYDGRQIVVPPGGRVDYYNGHAVAVPRGGRVEYYDGRQIVVPPGGRVDYYNGHAVAVPRGSHVEYENGRQIVVRD